MFALHKNHPNPFSRSTTIGYAVARGGGHVTLQIYDVRGQLVSTLVDAPQTEGQKTMTWDGRSSSGTFVAAGAYFVRLSAPGFERIRKIVLLK